MQHAKYKCIVALNLPLFTFAKNSSY